MMAVLLQIVGTLVALANALWLAARLVYPRDMSRLEATSIFLPIALIGVTLIVIGRRLGRNELDQLRKSAANKASHATSEPAPGAGSSSREG